MFKIKIVNSLDEIHLREDLPTFADIETDGLYVNTRLIQLYQPDTNEETVYIIDTDIIDLELAKDFLKPLWTVWHNASYDLGTLNIVTDKIDDTLYLAKSAYPEWQAFSLDNVIAKLGWNKLYAEFDKKAMQKDGFIKGSYISNKQLRYAATDVFALAQIWKNARIQATREVMAYKVDILALRDCIIWQQNGIPVLPDIYESYYSKALAEKEEFLAQLPDGLNPRSPKQVKELLGTDSSDKPTLMRKYINDGVEIAGTIMKARKALNDISKLNQFKYPRVYGRFNPAGAITGRWTCKGGDMIGGTNLQNYPRQFKGIFGVKPDSDLILITADYSTAELRAAASIYREPAMYKALKEGKDLHKFTASMIYGIPIEEVQGRQRSNAKVANFGFAFGLSAKTFVTYAFDLYNLKFTIAEAQELKNKWFAAYPAIGKYHKMCWDRMNDTETYICKTALGRRIAPKLGTDAINAPVQGSIAETMKLAIYYMSKENPDVLKYIINSVHDSIYLLAPEKEAEYWGDLVKRNMIKGWTELSKTTIMYYKDIPMPIDVAYGKSMTDLSDDFEGGGQALSIEEMEELNKMKAK